MPKASTAVASIAETYRVDRYTAAMILLWLLGQLGGSEPMMAEGGRVNESAYFFVPQGSRGNDFGRWPQAPAPDYPGHYAGYGREVTRRLYDQQRSSKAIRDLVESGQLRVNAQNWENFLKNAPRSTNIEDRRFYDPTKDEAMGSKGYQEGGRVYAEGGAVGDDYNTDLGADGETHIPPGQAEGGRVQKDQSAYFFVPQGRTGDEFGRWPRAPTPDYPGYIDAVDGSSTGT
jgi:hypothetical protein